MRRPKKGITVPQVISDMGIEPEPALCWSVGNEMRDLYQMRNNNELPPKDLRQKTNADGTHCFAIYPEEYRPDIERKVRRELEYRKSKPLQQPGLFDGWEQRR